MPLHLSRAAQRDADQRVGETLAGWLDPAGRAKVDEMLVRGKPIMAIKLVRELTGMRLVDAKRVVHSIQH